MPIDKNLIELKIYFNEDILRLNIYKNPFADTRNNKFDPQEKEIYKKQMQYLKIEKNNKLDLNN